MRWWDGKLVDCSQYSIFSWDRRDIARLIVNGGHLDFQMYWLGGSGGIIALVGGGPNHPRPLSSFDTQARWQPVTQSAQSPWSYGKIEDCEQSRKLESQYGFYTWVKDNNKLLYLLILWLIWIK